MKNKKKKTPDGSALMPSVEDAFLRTPVASACDCTGYAVSIPEDEEQARSYEVLCNVPCVPSDVTRERDDAANDTPERQGGEENRRDG